MRGHEIRVLTPGPPGPIVAEMAEPAEVFTRLATELAEVLGDDLLNLALHGSLNPQRT
jgi:hypothetical protein